MKPLLLKGHDRAITDLKYNKDGDLLFTCAKDHSPCAWYTEDGVRLGTYNGHTGAIWQLDVNESSTRLLTGSADNDAKLWDVETGSCLYTFSHKTPVRSVGFNRGDTRILTVTDNIMGYIPMVNIYPLAEQIEDQSSTPLLQLIGDGKTKITCALWSSLNEYIYTSSDDGSIRQWDTETGKCLKEVAAHQKSVARMSFSIEKGMIITASADTTAKVYDAKTLKLMKTYEADRPVNSAAISPNYNVVALGGGQEAASVTTTSTRIGKFQTLFYNMALQDQLFSVKGHFGPIHIVQFSPDGKGFASGSEDGYIRLHMFDDDYYNAIGSKQT